MIDRNRVMEKVRAMLNMTVERGCTEDEMMVAMAKARSMMDEHGITEEELAAEADTFQIEQFEEETKYAVNFAMRLSLMLSRYCDVKAWRARVGHKNYEFYIFGAEADRQLFTFLLKHLTSFIDREATAYAKDQLRLSIKLTGKADPGVLIDQWNSFAEGCMARILVRLKEGSKSRDTNIVMSDGRALVPMKMAVIKQALKERGYTFKSGGATTWKGRDRGAHEAGYEAGNRASFDRPINGGEGIRMIK